MLITIFGVAGASALIFTGFSVQQSISTINDKQFKEIIKYDMIVALNNNLDADEQTEFNNLSNNEKIDSKTSIYYESVSKEAGSKNDKQEIMFDPSLWIGAYIIPFIVVNIVTFVLKFYINKKLIKVNMIEALKSVD